MRPWIALLTLLFAFPLLSDTTVTRGSWDLYNGTSVVQRGFATEADCIRRADDINVVQSYTCQTSTTVNVTADAQTPTPTPAPLPTGSSYPLYTSLDLGAIPWHNGSGGWGSRVQLQAPALPVTNRQITVRSIGEFNSAAAVAGTQITIGSSWSGGAASISANDIDVVIPSGIAIGAVEVGVYPRNNAISRVRIRGPQGSRGGRIGQFRDFPLATDIVLDGIDINGDAPFGAYESNQAFRVSSTRLLIKDVRAIAAGYIWLGSAKHVVIAGSNFFHGAASESNVGFTGGWGIRNIGGPLTIVDSRIQGTRYNNLRLQPTSGQSDLLYVTRTTFVNASEGGRVAWLWDNLGADSSTGEGAIIEDSTVYSFGPAGCSAFADLRAPHASYSRVRRTRFFSGGTINWSQQTLNSMTKLGGGDHDWSVGNAFAALGGLPAWSGPGDPTQVPLPSGQQLQRAGQPPCLAP